MQHVKKDSGGEISRMNMKLNKRNCAYMLNNRKCNQVIPMECNTVNNKLHCKHSINPFSVGAFDTVFCEVREIEIMAENNKTNILGTNCDIFKFRVS